jgi:hypothetical protein
LKQVIADEAKSMLLYEKLLESDTESIVSSLEFLTGESDAESVDVLGFVLGKKLPERMSIPLEILEIICPTEKTFGPQSFGQVLPEKPLSEEILAMDRALSIIADFGKMFFKVKFRFEFLKLIAQWKLLLPERLKSIVSAYVEMANNLFENYNDLNRGIFIDFMKK